MNAKTFDVVKAKLLEVHPVEKWFEGLAPFDLLVSTILSQATERRGTQNAMQTLRSKGALTPSGILKLSDEQLEEALKPSGLFRNRARTLQALSERILRDYGGNLRFVMEMPLKRARETLESFPGVGPKTADVFLLFLGNGAPFPVDVHISRIIKRIAVVHLKAGYEEMRGTIENLTLPKERIDLHLSLIEHGREICRPAPKCNICCISQYCEKIGIRPNVNVEL